MIEAEGGRGEYVGYRGVYGGVVVFVGVYESFEGFGV